MKEWTLSDFAQMEIIRTKTEATLICDYVEDKPVRLSTLGFITSPDKSDFEIREEAWAFWQNFNEKVSHIKDE